MLTEQRRSRRAGALWHTRGTRIDMQLQWHANCFIHSLNQPSPSLLQADVSPVAGSIWQSHLRVTCGTCPISMMFPQRIRLRFTFVRSLAVNI